MFAKKGVLKWAAAALIVSTISGLFSCVSYGNSEGSKDEASHTEESGKKLLYGIAEPFAGTNVSGFNPEQEAALAGALGAKTFRLWMNDYNLFGTNYTSVLTESQLSQIPQSARVMYGAYAEALKAAGIEEITCMGMLFPRVRSTANGREGNYVPRRDLSTDGEYMEFLEKVKLLWKSVAAAFPQIAVWEMGNETNQSAFLNYADGEPTTEELAAINADYMYYARAGIKEGNPNATAITPGYAPVGGLATVKNFLEAVYNRIESGEYPAGEIKSRDADDYFDGVAWHPYDIDSGMALVSEPDTARWKSRNDEIYNVMKEHKDGEKSVWFTEFGYSLDVTALPEAEEGETDITRYTINGITYKLDVELENFQAEWTKKYFETMAEMEYVHTCHYFRLCCAKKDSEWGGAGEVYFGLFLEPDPSLGRGFYPRKKAYALQEIYGGNGDLSMYARI